MTPPSPPPAQPSWNAFVLSVQLSSAGDLSDFDASVRNDIAAAVASHLSLSHPYVDPSLVNVTVVPLSELIFIQLITDNSSLAYSWQQSMAIPFATSVSATRFFHLANVSIVTVTSTPVVEVVQTVVGTQPPSSPPLPVLCGADCGTAGGVAPWVYALVAVGCVLAIIILIVIVKKVATKPLPPPVTSIMPDHSDMVAVNIPANAKLRTSKLRRTRSEDEVPLQDIGTELPNDVQSSHLGKHAKTTSI